MGRGWGKGILRAVIWIAAAVPTTAGACPGDAGAKRRLIDNERVDVMSDVINHSAGAATAVTCAAATSSSRAASFYDGITIIITTPDPWPVIWSLLARHTCLHALFRLRKNRFCQKKKKKIHFKLPL